MNFLSYLINGISLGSVYAIIALGYTMVYGIAKMLNFAHGDVIMIGCYVVFLAMSGQGISPLPAVVLSIIVCTVLGIVVEKIAYKPAAKSNAACRAHHSDRCQLFPAECGIAAVWSGYEIIQFRCVLAFLKAGRRRVDHFRHNHCHRAGMRGDYDRTDDVH